MLRIYETALEVIRLLRPVREELKRHDPHLAEQLTDASNGVAQCIAEGSYSRGRNRHSLYHRALGSAKESGACLDIALANGYLESIDPRIRAGVSSICAVLYTIVT